MKFIATSGAALFPLLMSAQEIYETEPEKNIFITLFPFIVVIFILVFLYKRSNTSRSYLDRANAHMDKMEQNTEKIISLLEQIKDNKKNNS